MKVQGTVEEQRRGSSAEDTTHVPGIFIPSLQTVMGENLMFTNCATGFKFPHFLIFKDS